MPSTISDTRVGQLAERQRTVWRSSWVKSFHLGRQ